MRPLIYVLPYAAVFWAVFLWAFIPEFAIVRRAREGASAAGSADAGSTWVIMLGMWLALAAAFPLASVGTFQIPPPAQPFAFWAGVTVLVGGSLLRRHCWRMLGAHFTGDVRAHADQPIVASGAYAILRHPSYTAGTLMNLGIGVALGSLASVVVLTVMSIAVYVYRMNVEERALLAAIGEPYRRFMETRKRLIPFIY